MTTSLNESTVETTALEWFEELGYEILHGPELAPGEPGPEHAISETGRMDTWQRQGE